MGVLSKEIDDPEEQEELWYLAARAARGFALSGVDVPDEMIARLEILRVTKPTVMDLNTTDFRTPRKVARYNVPRAAEDALRIRIKRAGERLDSAVRGKPTAVQAQLVAEQTWTGDTNEEQRAAGLDAFGALGVRASVQYASTAEESAQRRMAEYFGRMYAEAGETAAIDGLLHLVDDPSQIVWARALAKLRERGSQEVAAALIARVERDGITAELFDVSAIRVIGDLGGPPALSFLNDQLRNPDIKAGLRQLVDFSLLGSRDSRCSSNPLRDPTHMRDAWRPDSSPRSTILEQIPPST